MSTHAAGGRGLASVFLFFFPYHLFSKNSFKKKDVKGEVKKMRVAAGNPNVSEDCKARVRLNSHVALIQVRESGNVSDNGNLTFCLF